MSKEVLRHEPNTVRLTQGEDSSTRRTFEKDHDILDHTVKVSKQKSYCYTVKLVVRGLCERLIFSVTLLSGSLLINSSTPFGFE